MKAKIFLLLMLFFTGLSYGQIRINFATVAPEGSTWMKVMRDYAKAVEDGTENRIKFRIYSGQVAGDEDDVIRKIRIGQLDSGGFTGVGMGIIVPEIRILDSPFLFNNYDEVDYVIGELEDYFKEKFEKKGYLLLGWAEVGFVYIFTNTPLTNLDDMRGVKMWMWENDPIAEATFKSFGINPIPLSIADVMTSLQTKMINGIYGSPYACVALQWNTKVKYMFDLSLALSSGAVLISKRKFNKLSEADQAVVIDLSEKYFRELTLRSRKDNQSSLQLMKESGITVTSLDDPDKLQGFYKSGNIARRSLVGKLYEEDLLKQVDQLLEDFRKEKAD